MTYRPICLLNCISKLVDHILVYRINNEPIGENGLFPKQFGFRPGRSTANVIKIILRGLRG